MEGEQEEPTAGPSQRTAEHEEQQQTPEPNPTDAGRRKGRFVSPGTAPTMYKCYVCGSEFQSRLFRGLDGDSRANLRVAATTLRDSLHPEMAREACDTDKLCANCHQMATKLAQDQENQTGLLLPVVLGGSRACIICKSKKDVTTLSLKARLQAYVDIKAFIVKSSRCCTIHLKDDGTIIHSFYGNIHAVARRVFLKPEEVVQWFDGLSGMVREAVQKYFEDEDNFTDEDFKIFTGLTKLQLEDLYKKCIPVPADGNRKASRKDLIMFIVKMRQGLSDDFLHVMFRLSTRQLVSKRISTVTLMLAEHFVPTKLGLDPEKHMSRDEFIEKHSSEFANKLYNDNYAQDGQKKVILIIDGTYLYIPKFRNYKVLRQSFSVHKGRHLVKPVLVVAPDGYILDAHGPYFADSKNNDASILEDNLKQRNSLKDWLQPGDIILVDRGYRDCIPYLESLGLKSKMPDFLTKGMKQHPTEEANKSRLVTKSRWVVESRNGHIKSIFKIFRDMVPASQVLHIGNYFRIACALLNAYYPLINMMGATDQMADKMLEQSQKPNLLKELIEREHLDRATAGDPWWDLNAAQYLPGFPVLSLDYLRDLTFGVYQVKQAKSYTHDKIDRDSEYTIQIKLSKPGILRARIWSRFRNETKHNTWIQYAERDLEDINSAELIKGWYCTCKVGSRTLGCCAHVASVLWYLGYARHQPSTSFPTSAVLHEILDAGHRTLPHIID